MGINSINRSQQANAQTPTCFGCITEYLQSLMDKISKIIQRFLSCLGANSQSNSRQQSTENDTNVQKQHLIPKLEQEAKAVPETLYTVEVQHSGDEDFCPTRKTYATPYRLDFTTSISGINAAFYMPDLSDYNSPMHLHLIIKDKDANVCSFLNALLFCNIKVTDSLMDKSPKNIKECINRTKKIELYGFDKTAEVKIWQNEHLPASS